MNRLILLVEDNEQIMSGNERMLNRRGYKTITAMTLKDARAAVKNHMPDAIVLDIMLPDGSGLDFMRDVRRSSGVPILLLTGLTTPKDVVRGLTEGGDDYLTKPYDFDVLLARIEALLRRATHVPETLTKGALRFDIMASQAFLNGEDLLLPKKEFSLLLLLAKNEGRTLSSEYLYETVWKQPMGDDDGAVKSQLSRLRKKLGDGFSLQYNSEESGYIFESLAE